MRQLCTDTYISHSEDVCDEKPETKPKRSKGGKVENKQLVKMREVGGSVRGYSRCLCEIAVLPMQRESSLSPNPPQIQANRCDCNSDKRRNR